MIEVARALEWIYTTLSTDTTVANLIDDRIYDGVAPQGSAYPLIIFNHQARRNQVLWGVAALGQIIGQRLIIIQAKTNHPI